MSQSHSIYMYSLTPFESLETGFSLPAPSTPAAAAPATPPAVTPPAATKGAAVSPPPQTSSSPRVPPHPTTPSLRSLHRRPSQSLISFSLPATSSLNIRPSLSRSLEPALTGLYLPRRASSSISHTVLSTPPWPRIWFRWGSGM